MQDVLGIVLFFAGVAFIAFSNRLAKWTSSVHSREAKNYGLKAISDVKWDSPYMLTIARIGMIIWGIVLILAAYTAIFGTINLVQQPQSPSQVNTSSSSAQ
jgi:hypothetical protein